MEQKQNSSNKKQDNPELNLPENQGDTEQFIEVLIEHQRNCERSGKYVEADIAKNKINELKINLDKKKKEELKNRHLSEKMGVDQAHLDEFNKFNEFWDRKMAEYSTDAANVEKELVTRQQQEEQKVLEELEKAIPYKPKESSEILNLKKIEEHLAKQKNYVEAHQVQSRRLELEKNEYNNWLNIRQTKIKNQLSQLKQRQNNELNALRQRIIAGEDEQKKYRSIELERLLQKYQNVKLELNGSHEKEILAEQKLFKSKAQTSLQSRYTGSRLNPSKQQ